MLLGLSYSNLKGISRPVLHKTKENEVSVVTRCNTLLLAHEKSLVTQPILAHALLMHMTSVTMHSWVNQYSQPLQTQDCNI